MVVVCPVKDMGVQVQPGFDSEGLQEMPDKVGGKPRHIVTAERHFQHGICPTAQVYRHQSQGVIHRHERVSHADDTCFLSQGSGQRLPQADSHVLNQMMLVVSDSLQLEVEPAVLYHLGQQMVEHVYSGIDVPLPVAVYVQFQADIRLPGLSGNFGSPACNQRKNAEGFRDETRCHGRFPIAYPV